MLDNGNIFDNVLINSTSFANVSGNFKFSFLNSYSILSSVVSSKSSLSLKSDSHLSKKFFLFASMKAL